MSQKRYYWPRCPVTPITAFCHIAEAAGFRFSAQTPGIVDFGLWKSALHLCVTFLSPESHWLHAHVLWEPQAQGPPLLGHSWEGLVIKWFASGITLRVSGQFFHELGNWSALVEFQLINTFWLKESNSIKVFVTEQIYLHHVLRIMPKPFVLKKKELNWRKAFNRIGLE